MTWLRVSSDKDSPNNNGRDCHLQVQISKSFVQSQPLNFSKNPLHESASKRKVTAVTATFNLPALSQGSRPIENVQGYGMFVQTISCRQSLHLLCGIRSPSHQVQDIPASQERLAVHAGKMSIEAFRQLSYLTGTASGHRNDQQPASPSTACTPAFLLALKEL